MTPNLYLPIAIHCSHTLLVATYVATSNTNSASIPTQPGSGRFVRVHAPDLQIIVTGYTKKMRPTPTM
jgi:hypothetical protein